ncbi:MAG: phosphodiester glycosidase family protein [Bacteroidota bacterium]
MKNINILVLFVLIVINSNVAQNINWIEITSEYDFPAGLKLFHGTIPGNDNFEAWYYEVDLTVEEIAIRPYLTSGTQQVDDFSDEVGAYGAINGGFFAGTSSVSSVIYPDEVLARNLISVNRNDKTYPVIRPVFAMNQDRTLSAEWVYHHSYNFDDIYIYERPLSYTCDDPDPLPVPSAEEGTQYENIAYGIGGGPMLIKNGEIDITYCEEVWWGSGVYLTDFRPRSAVGYTEENKAIFFVTNSMKIEEMAEELASIGCYEAMNLDGGGSSAMAAGSESIYDQGRAVPSILAIVHTDSLYLPQTPEFEKIIDTSDEEVSSQGSWFETANDGFWETPSLLHPLGSDDDFYEFPLHLPQPGEYEIYGWWVSHSNRASDTPFIIEHAEGVTEERVDQSINGSRWAHIGTYRFNGDASEKVTITADATTNDYVVADAIRVVSYDDFSSLNQIAGIEDVEDIYVETGTSLEDALAMLSDQTTITNEAGISYTVDLNWSSDDYNGSEPGVYNATGIFDLPEEVEQTDPPTPLEVTALITVQDNETNVVEQSGLQVKIYPNPGDGIFTLDGDLSRESQIQIMGLDGRVINKTVLSGNGNHTLKLDNLSPGIYLMKISNEKGSLIKKIVIE